MKSVEFNEDRLQDLQQIGMELFADETDPRSTAYVRTLNRPRIHWLRICAYVLLPLAVLAAFVAGLRYAGVRLWIGMVLAAVFLLAYLLLTLKLSLICLIRIYQRYAPDHVRNKCRFEPSCSEYMILSIEKYGVQKGVKKGIRRLKRCNIHHGGFDLP